MKHCIEFAIFPNVLGLDIMGPLEVFNTATTIVEQKCVRDSGYRFKFVATQRGPVRLSSGLAIVADASFADMSPGGTLLVPGGIGVLGVLDDADFMDYLRAKAAQVERILSVCNGAFLLAAAGILDGKDATTHWLIAEHMATSYPEVRVSLDAIFTRDGNVYTSAGVTAGIDLALAVVEEDFGAEIALEVSRLLVLYFRRPGSQSQFSAPLKAQQAAGQRFSKLHTWLIDNLAQSISVEQMAEYSAMSPRNFARVFKATTNMTPAKYLETLRLDRARELLIAGNQSLESVATISGFGREERLRRAFQRRFNITPSHYRQHGNTS